MCGINDTQVLGCCNGMVGGSGGCCDDGAYAWSFTLHSGTVVASLSSTAVPAPAAVSASKDHTPAIIGGTIAGVAAGVIAACFICCLLYRRHKQKTLNKTTGVSFPPDSPINKPGFKHVADAELNTHPNMVVELPTSRDPGELDATPTSSPNLINRVSAITTGDNARWSAVSSLSPPRVHSLAPAAGVTPMAASLQAVSQQHYGSGQRSYLLAPGDNPSSVQIALGTASCNPSVM